MWPFEFWQALDSDTQLIIYPFDRAKKKLKLALPWDRR
jgi:hypothetical protein